MIYPPYHHPKAETILEDVKTILSASAKGKAYWETNKAPITIIRGPLPQAFVMEDKSIILRVPALQQRGRVEQAIDLAGAFAEIKLNARKSGPSPDKITDNDTLVGQHMKNVEIILKAFEVAAELEDQGYDAVKELRLMGVGKIWQAWKTGADLEKCANIYWQMFDNNEQEEGTE
ncbi:MAG: hypothetical protein ACLFR0_00570 [Alphaproteobacteria bacterium]